MVSVPVLNTSPVIVEWLQRGLSRRKFRHIRGTSRRFRRLLGPASSQCSLLDWELSTAEGFKDNRAARKKKYRGELFPANVGADGLGTPFREFFQHDKDGNPKGAVVIILMDLP